MKLKEIIKIINTKYPEKLQYGWDNSGLNIGDIDSEINKILLCLDINDTVLEESIKKGVDLIISHHPFIFEKINQIRKDDIKGSIIYKAIKNNISVYCMHTNYDIAFDGLNDYFMGLIGINEYDILEFEGKSDDYLDGREYGLGRVGKLDTPMKMGSFIEFIKEKLRINRVRLVGNPNDTINKVAVVTGSGAEFFKMAKNLDVDILITGDLKYHQAVDADELGISILDCGHYGTEKIFSDSIIMFLEENLVGVEIIKSETEKNPIIEI